MTFQDMLAADLVHLTDTDYFGSSATYTDPSGQTTALTVVLFEERTESPENNGIKTKLRIRDCTWSSADLSTVNRRGKLTIDSVEWAIAEVVFQDERQVSVRLERHELHEHTRPEYRRR